MSFMPIAQNVNMTDDEFLLLRNLVYGECGLWLKDEKKSFMAHRALKRMRFLNITSFFRYYKLLTDMREGKSELLYFLDDLTINETSFFRNRPQIDLFSNQVLPEMISAKRQASALNLKLWSAGCSTGQEPYTLAMVLRHSLLDIKNWRVTILASDLSLTALQAAQRGTYHKDKLEGVERKYLDSYFQKSGDDYAITDDTKRLVVFDYHNLMHDSGERGFDIIFCRNVLIYFDEPTQKKVIEKFENALNPGGYLFLGHSETLQGINDHFTFIHSNRGTAYRKK